MAPPHVVSRHAVSSFQYTLLDAAYRHVRIGEPQEEEIDVETPFPQIGKQFDVDPALQSVVRQSSR